MSLYVWFLFKHFFLRNRSLSNARWFYNKKRKTEKDNLYLTENRLSTKEMWCAADIYNYMGHIFANGFLDSNFNKAVIAKYPIFKKLPQILRIHKNRKCFSIIETF